MLNGVLFRLNIRVLIDYFWGKSAVFLYISLFLLLQNVFHRLYFIFFLSHDYIHSLVNWLIVFREQLLLLLVQLLTRQSIAIFFEFFLLFLLSISFFLLQMKIFDLLLVGFFFPLQILLKLFLVFIIFGQINYAAILRDRVPSIRDSDETKLVREQFNSIFPGLNAIVNY